MEITITFIFLCISFFAIYSWGEYNGIRKGANEMYTHLYNQGVRKNDHVIVKLEYEDRSGTKEF
tara:strand:- start:5577 stop:5768 length:192 start_codon:yes stop_codon:yes gene_type:complete